MHSIEYRCIYHSVLQINESKYFRKTVFSEKKTVGMAKKVGMAESHRFRQAVFSEKKTVGMAKKVGMVESHRFRQAVFSEKKKAGMTEPHPLNPC